VQSTRVDCRKYIGGQGKQSHFWDALCSERLTMTIRAMHHGGIGPSKTDGEFEKVKDPEDGHKRPGERR
jgi:hypothetical protein